MAGTKKKKGTSGNAVEYMARNQCLKKLQLSLSDFRKLCILKGIYPKDPKKKLQGKDKTYYSTKDIKFLMHDPVIDSFRKFRIYKRKAKKLRARREPSRLETLKQSKPDYDIQHVIKERYPTFSLALRDMPDALCMLNLFENVPQSVKITQKRVSNLSRLSREFNLYVMSTHSLKKSFISIKGIYYEAEIFGESIIWLVPFKYPQDIPKNVDIRVMSTFLKLYETLVGFVNFKLFTSAGIFYPPKDTEEGWKIQRETKEEEKEEEDDDIPQEIDQPKKASVSKQQNKKKLLFAGHKFFLSREVPKESLEFVIKSSGGQVSWEHKVGGFTEDDQSITHHIIDRPSLPQLKKGRDYVQPQWVYDCINISTVLPVDEYKMGASLPPHLSPWVNDEEEGYVPERALELEKISEGVSVSTNNDEESEEENSDSENENEDEDKYSAELEAERKGITFTEFTEETKANKKRSLAEISDKIDEEQTDAAKRKRQKKEDKQQLAVSLMQKKNRRLYERMTYTMKQKEAKNEKLIQKKEKLKQSKKQSKSVEPDNEQDDSDDYNVTMDEIESNSNSDSDSDSDGELFGGFAELNSDSDSDESDSE